MEEIHIGEFEFAHDYFEPIKRIVRENNPFIGSVYLDDIYHLDEYMMSTEGIKFNVLLDNNIFTRLIYLSKEGEIEGNTENIKILQFCCAVMCFFVLGGFNIEPNIALYEKASKNTHSNAISDLFDFRVADHIHPMAYAELALGVRNKFHKEEIEVAKNLVTPRYLKVEETNYEKRLDDWKVVYLHLLKIYELSKSEVKDIQKIKSFLEWIVHDCFSTPVSTIFALIFFSQKGCSFGTMIKKVNSTNLDKLKDGLKNAAWDLTYITKFRKLSKNQPEDVIWFFCSHDKVLKKIARILFLKKEESMQIALDNLINEFWGKNKKSSVIEYYQKMEISVTGNKEMRIQHNRKVRYKIDSMIERQESKIFE